MSYPTLRKCVAKKCRNLWQLRAWRYLLYGGLLSPPPVEPIRSGAAGGAGHESRRALIQMLLGRRMRGTMLTVGKWKKC
ncbi:MAG: hypothetical protein ACE5H0_08220 [Bacteroidota bacterium]